MESYKTSENWDLNGQVILQKYLWQQKCVEKKNPQPSWCLNVYDTLTLTSFQILL